MQRFQGITPGCINQTKGGEMKKHVHYGHPIQTRVSASLWTAILERCNRTGETVDHIIQSALATELDIKHHTLFQVSTSSALVQGVYAGCMQVGEIKKHGNFGLGTFDLLDGEGIMLDGEVWQAKSDGSLALVDDNQLAPFWVTTNFAPEISQVLESVISWDNLCEQIDCFRKSQNVFIAIKITGVFAHLKYRVACQTAHGTDLVTATSRQALFERDNCSGTLVGFWTPSYAKTFNVPGYHLHLLSDDRHYGGHVLDIRGSNLKLQFTCETEMKIALTETASFLAADLNIDPTEALTIAEGSRIKPS